MSASEPQQHVITSAAVADDVHAPAEPHARERKLLWALAVTASLPRVLWGLTFDAMNLVRGDASWDSSFDLSSVIMVLRFVGLGLDIACLVILGLLHPLDRVVPDSHGRRVAALTFGIVELFVTFLLSDVWNSIAGIIPLYIGFGLPSFLASLFFARYLAVLLKPRAAMLVPVVVGQLVLQTFVSALFGRLPLVGTLMGVLVAVEVLRARRNVAER